MNTWKAKLSRRAGAGGGRWRARLGVLTLLAGGLAVPVVAVAPGAASAGAIVPCPDSITDWRLIAQSRAGRVWEGYRYTLHSATPIFLVSDGQLLDNGTDSTVNYTITSRVSRTFTIQSTVGISATGQDKFFTTNVSTQIVMTQVTERGVSIAVPVPPRTRLIAEYGVEAYQVAYAVEAWRAPTRLDQQPVTGGRCEEWGYYPQSATAPTHIEGWRLRIG
ncbi:hypothetical protein [Plantactinospora endophytica]|uniref:Uncharacterized protein n=1 Tax=Plantactinospora endophytica TaxID=673535 RepID=A0ABQ4DWK5_9ACTN|nr:hypothetical protein [Plantactinospora endophytica]GIG86824.1 hypothetical protein Pen02_17600 [Plantactinospora endophytica]